MRSQGIPFFVAFRGSGIVLPGESVTVNGNTFSPGETVPLRFMSQSTQRYIDNSDTETYGKVYEPFLVDNQIPQPGASSFSLSPYPIIENVTFLSDADVTLDNTGGQLNWLSKISIDGRLFEIRQIFYTDNTYSQINPFLSSSNVTIRKGYGIGTPEVDLDSVSLTFSDATAARFRKTLQTETFLGLDAAVNFNGIDNYILVPDSPGTGFTSSFTLASLVRVDSFAGVDNDIIYSKPGYVIMEVLNDGSVRARVRTTGGLYTVNSSVSILSNWVWVVIVYDEPSLSFKMYTADIDGSNLTLRDSVATVGPLLLPGPANSVFGGNGSADKYMDGAMAMFWKYDSVFDIDKIRNYIGRPLDFSDTSSGSDGEDLTMYFDLTESASSYVLERISGDEFGEILGTSPSSSWTSTRTGRTSDHGQLMPVNLGHVEFFPAYPDNLLLSSGQTWFVNRGDVQRITGVFSASYEKLAPTFDVTSADWVASASQGTISSATVDVSSIAEGQSVDLGLGWSVANAGSYTVESVNNGAIKVVESLVDESPVSAAVLTTPGFEQWEYLGDGVIRTFNPNQDAVLVSMDGDNASPLGYVSSISEIINFISTVMSPSLDPSEVGLSITLPSGLASAASGISMFSDGITGEDAILDLLKGTPLSFGSSNGETVELYEISGPDLASSIYFSQIVPSLRSIKISGPPVKSVNMLYCPISSEPRGSDIGYTVPPWRHRKIVSGGEILNEPNQTVLEPEFDLAYPNAVEVVLQCSLVFSVDARYSARSNIDISRMRTYEIEIDALDLENLVIGKTITVFFESSLYKTQREETGFENGVDVVIVAVSPSFSEEKTALTVLR